MKKWKNALRTGIGMLLLTAVFILAGVFLVPGTGVKVYASGIPDGTSVTIAEIFPDPVLAQWVADNLSPNADIYSTPNTEQLAGIAKTSLTYPETADIKDYEGIKYLTSLQIIDITYAVININDFINMNNLKSIFLAGNEVTGDLSSLSNLTNLTPD